MRTPTFSILVILMLGAALMSTIAPAQPSAQPAVQPIAAVDRIAVERIMAGQVDAWNRHDMHAFAADMTPDADWINVVGMHWQGREAVERAHTGMHRMPLFAHSRMMPGAAEMRSISPDVILVVERSRIEGAGPTPGGGVYPSGGAIMTMVFVRTAAGWRIAHGHNTYVDAAAAANDPATKAPR